MTPKNAILDLQMLQMLIFTDVSWVAGPEHYASEGHIGRGGTAAEGYGEYLCKELDLDLGLELGASV